MPMRPLYPTIPQLWGSTGTTDDTFMSREESELAIDRCTLMTEKLDGVNIGLGGPFCEPLLKGQPVSTAELRLRVPHIDDLGAWARGASLPKDHVIFGEWCSSPTRARAWRVFDVLCLATKRFAPWHGVTAM